MEEKEILVRQRIKITNKICAFCGKSFKGTLQAKYCSQNCRLKADYEKHREDRLRKQREKYSKQKEQKQQMTRKKSFLETKIETIFDHGVTEEELEHPSKRGQENCKEIC